jgi:hypothetical protein
MASRRVFQQAALQAVRMSVNRPVVRAITRSNGFYVNKGVISNCRPSLLLRHYSSSSVFKVVDYNDIQNTIKNEGKVGAMYVVGGLCAARYRYSFTYIIGLSFN